jgi:hypothetical protein
MWIKQWSSKWVSIRYINSEELKNKLGLPSTKPNLCNLRMANQTITKHVWLIKNLKIHIHGILYINFYYHLEYGIGCYLPYVVKKTMVERCHSFTWLGYKIDSKAMEMLERLSSQKKLDKNTKYCVRSS